MGPFRFLGAAGLAFVVLDALLGWRGARIPLLGGTMFDGVRFYGLPNSFIALLLASAMFVAAGMGSFGGFLLLLASGSEDSTVLIWDVTGRLAQEKPAPLSLVRVELDQLCKDLADPDEGRVRRILSGV